MNRTSRNRGFTIIELLTVIAIIAVLAAILFPVAATVREQARASSCMSNLHQLWVAVNVYKQDEGGYPPALHGYAERADTHAPIVDPDGADSDQVLPGGVIAAGAAYRVKLTADQIVNGFLYPEQIKDVNLLRCPDNLFPAKNAITIAHYPEMQDTDPTAAYYWPKAKYNWIGDVLKAKGCPSDSYGTIDCFTEGPFAGQPKWYYASNSYDVAPRIGADGKPVKLGDLFIYDRHYSLDWTGTPGAADLPAQLKYDNPPSDKTLLVYCTWHTATNGSNTMPGISLGGTAKKLNAEQLVKSNALLFYK